jgi:hypothetical protein
VRFGNNIDFEGDEEIRALEAAARNSATKLVSKRPTVSGTLALKFSFYS